MANTQNRRSFFYNQHSFTLVELLIVIGILAILVATIVVVLNPAQLLAQARDSKRQQDLASLNQALSLIEQQSGSSATLPSGYASTTVFTSLPDDTSSTCGSWNLPSLPTGWTYHCTSSTTLQNIDSTGWIPLNFNTLTFGATQLSLLPLDPVNTSSTGLYYTYVAGGSFELNAILESQKYRFLDNPRNLPGIIAQGSDLSLSPMFTTSGLIGYWNFDNTALDQINNEVGTWYGTSTERYATEKIISVASFNGVSDYLRASNPSAYNFGTGDFSISFWAKAGLGNSGGYFIGNKNNPMKTKGWYIIEGSDDLFKFTYITSTNPINLQLTSSIPQDWVHIVIVRSVDKLDAWENGNHVSSAAPNYASIDGTSGLSFGRLIMGGAYWGGRLDDVRIYNRAISDAEVVALYNATR